MSNSNVRALESVYLKIKLKYFVEETRSERRRALGINLYPENREKSENFKCLVSVAADAN